MLCSTAYFVWISTSVFVIIVEKCMNEILIFIGLVACTAVVFTKPICYQDFFLGLTVLSLWRFLLRTPPPAISCQFRLSIQEREKCINVFCL